MIRIGSLVQVYDPENMITDNSVHDMYAVVLAVLDVEDDYEYRILVNERNFRVSRDEIQEV